MVKLTIDGRQVEAQEGAMVLDVARDHHIYIPTLCQHESVTPYGACRLCLVDITTRSGRNRLVTSCLYLVEEGLVVKTSTERVVSNRKVLLQLLMARCPESDVVQAMGHKLGVESTPFPLENHHKCILCALCTRVCAEVVGVSAISFVNRGIEREMAIPFFDDKNACIACGSCAYICPTSAITLEDVGNTRYIHQPFDDMKFKMAQCTDCGRYWAPEKQIAWMAKQSGRPLEFFNKCPDCR